MRGRSPATPLVKVIAAHPDVGAAVFYGHERTPEADVDKVASAIKPYSVQRLELQRLACGIDQMIEGADVPEKPLHLRLIREVNDVAFRPAFQRR